ncbi:MAG: hypothetical protein QNL71_04950 [Akkermansiaceae bacterium]
MNRLFYCLIAYLIFSFSSNGAESERNWSDGNGNDFSGTLLWFDGEHAFIKRKGKGEATVEINNLSAADRKYLIDFRLAKSSENIAHEFVLESIRYSSRDMSPIAARKRGIYFVDKDQEKGSLELIFKNRGKIPESAKGKRVVLKVGVADTKGAATKDTLLIKYGGRIIGKRRGLKRGGYRDITLASDFWGDDQSLELVFLINSHDGAGIMTEDSSHPPRLFVKTTTK